MLTKPRKDLRTVIGLLTVHNVPASHASGMSISNNDTCRKYRYVGMKEALEYLLCFCPALSRTRQISRSFAVQGNR